MEDSDFSEFLPDEDVLFLSEKYRSAKVYRVGEEVHVLFPGFPFPGYQPAAADLLVRLLPGYPDANPDMFWTQPDIKLPSGAWPSASEHHEVPGNGPGSETYSGVPWQRWSRHIQRTDWRSGIDGLRTFIRTIQSELGRKI
jgi:hypothetical protein